MTAEQLLSVIQEVASDIAQRSGLEADIKQEVVMRILQSIGWNIFNRQEVNPEYLVGNSRVDYALINKGKAIVFVEVKRGGEELTQHEEQLLNYAFKQSVKLSVLTNGKIWRMYLPMQEGEWKDRIFDTIDIGGDRHENVADHLMNFLSKDKVCSGEAERLAKDYWNHGRVKQYIAETLKNLSDDERYINLIIQVTEEKHHVKPTEIEVKKFLADQKRSSIIPDTVGKTSLNVDAKADVKPTGRKKDRTWRWAFCEAVDPDGGNLKRYSNSVECWRAEIGDPKLTGFTGLQNRDATDSFHHKGWELEYGDPNHKEKGMRVIRPKKS